MGNAENDQELRFTRLEDEIEALERKVEVLREEIRSLARLVGSGDIATHEPIG
jgi:hypothetical protein